MEEEVVGLERGKGETVHGKVTADSGRDESDLKV